MRSHTRSRPPTACGLPSRPHTGRTPGRRRNRSRSPCSQGPRAAWNCPCAPHDQKTRSSRRSRSRRSPCRSPSSPCPPNRTGDSSAATSRLGGRSSSSARTGAVPAACPTASSWRTKAPTRSRSTPTREACASARAPGRRPSQGTSCSSYWRLAGARTGRTGEKRPANRDVFKSLAIARAVRPLEGSNRSPSASPRNRLPTGIAAGGVYPRPVTSPRTVLERALERLAQVGADPADDPDTRQRKAPLVLISVLILPIAVVWGVLYLALGSPVGYVPLAYSLVLLGAIGVFARTRDVVFFLRVSLLAILFAPTLSMIPVGGFVGSAGVGLWGILAPMGALVFGGVRASVRWYAAFVAVFVGRGVARGRGSSNSPLS